MNVIKESKIKLITIRFIHLRSFIGLKKLHQMMSLDEIEQIMDDTREGIEHQRVIENFQCDIFQ